MPVNVIVTSGTTADCTQAIDLIEEIEAEALIADRAYDTNEIIDFSQTKDMKRVIPSKKNRVNPHRHDELLYRRRHLIENTFLKLKSWRGIATRFAKTSSAFSGSVWLASICLWLKSLS
jgi:transposase